MFHLINIFYSKLPILSNLFHNTDPTVGPRIAYKFVQKFLRAIQIRTVRDYYLLVSDPNEFKNRAISRNFTIKSHYLRNFSKKYILLLLLLGIL